MKKLPCLIILAVVVCQISKGQRNLPQIPAVDLLLKQAAVGDTNLVIISRREPGKYINMSVLDKIHKTLTWFTCYGSAYDSVQLVESECDKMIAHSQDPFDFYKNFFLEDVSYLEDAVARFRQLGSVALKDTLYNRRLVYNSSQVRAAASPLQKVIAIESLIRKQYLQLYLFDGKSPSHLFGTDSFRTRQSLAGKMVWHSDTVAYYNAYPLGAAAKVVLCKKLQQKMFVFNEQGDLVDSVPLKLGKHASLLKTKEDVFLLYRGWLEMQSQQVLNAKQQIADLLARQNNSLFTESYWLENKWQLHFTISQLDEQQRIIEDKIMRLILPDAHLVNDMLKNAYPDASPEISYLSQQLGFSYTTSYVRGQKIYELTEQRGNVMAVLSDKKKGIDNNGDGVVDYYNADVVNANDYFPFGSLMPGRTYSTANKYKYGYNGKENDNDIKGEGNQQNYGMRIYDPRIGRFLSIDPLTKGYPELTPYQFASNTPIQAIDLDGLESVKVGNDVENLIIVIQGAMNPRKDPEKVTNGGHTLADNVALGRGNSIGRICSNLGNTQVVTYVSTHAFELTPTDVYSTIYNYRKENPDGKVILVGHSLGAANLQDVMDQMSVATDINNKIDLMITLDPASNRASGKQDLNLKSNVIEAINFMSDAKYNHYIGFTLDGGKLIPDDEKTTNYTNILIPKSSHGNIDNTLAGLITTTITNYLFRGKDPLTEMKKIDPSKIPVIQDVDTHGSSGR